MNKTLEIQELAIVVVAKNHNPTLLNPDFLKCSGIIPAEWELARQPVYTNQVAQLVFQNGLSLVAQADRIIFLEELGSKAPDEIQTPPLAYQYLQALPHGDYQAVGINTRGYVAFPGESEGAHQYLFNTLFAPGPWQEMGTEPVRAGVNLVYTFERNRLHLSINAAAMQLPEQAQVPVVVFGGNFDYDLTALPESDRLGEIKPILDHWQTDLETYRNVVHQFLEKDVPTLIPMPA